MAKQSTISTLSDLELDAIGGGHGKGGHAYGHAKQDNRQTVGDVSGTINNPSGGNNVAGVGIVNGGIRFG
jgi:hypothetical protein